MYMKRYKGYITKQVIEPTEKTLSRGSARVPKLPKRIVTRRPGIWRIPDNF